MIDLDKQNEFYQEMSWFRERIRYKLAEEINRVPSKWIKLSKNEEDRFSSIIEKYIKISLHDHTFVYPEKPEEFIEYIREGLWWIGFKGLAYSRLDAVFDGLFDGAATIRSPDPWTVDNIVHQIGIFKMLIDRNKDTLVATHVNDIINSHRDGKLSFIIHLEGPPRVGEDFLILDILYGLGVRCIGVAYSRGNEFGSGLADKIDHGLTDYGYEFVDRLNKLGIAIDIAHAGDQTSIDTIEASKYPVFISHAGARSLWPTNRMKPDNVIQAMAEKSGVIGIEASPHTTLTKKYIRHSIESIMQHFQYIEKLVGIEYVAFGPDTLFGDHAAYHKVFTDLSVKRTHGEEELKYPHVDFVDGLENPSQYTNIIRWLVKNGYSDDEISKVIGGNILRVLKKIWK